MQADIVWSKYSYVWHQEIVLSSNYKAKEMSTSNMGNNYSPIPPNLYPLLAPLGYL